MILAHPSQPYRFIAEFVPGKTTTPGVLAAPEAPCNYLIPVSVAAGVLSARSHFVSSLY